MGIVYSGFGGQFSLGLVCSHCVTKEPTLLGRVTKLVWRRA